MLVYVLNFKCKKKKDKDLEGGQQLPCTLRNMDLEKCP